MATHKQQAREAIRKALEPEKLYARPLIANEVQQAFDNAKAHLAVKMAEALEKAGVLRDDQT
jgi:hypothetical protein